MERIYFSPVLSKGNNFVVVVWFGFGFGLFSFEPMMKILEMQRFYDQVWNLKPRKEILETGRSRWSQRTITLKLSRYWFHCNEHQVLLIWEINIDWSILMSSLTCAVVFSLKQVSFFSLVPSQRIISYLSCPELVLFLQNQHCFPACCCKHQRQEKWLWLYKSIKPYAQTAINKLKRCLEIQTTSYKVITKGSATQSSSWLLLQRKYF